MKSTEIRQVFLDYFKKNGHEIVSSSSLIPGNDATLLFTNAGMVQFKEVFLGQEQRAYHRAASSQRCVRAGGKHNDLENVGYTARHHTFFEMLGNFSFGDYFKREAIRYAWEFLTEVLKIPPSKLWVTVFEEDDEAADIWLNEMKIDPTRFSRCGEADNFWAMGDTGPCGPCSEIFYDHGPEIAGGPPGSPEADGDRYIEIWNLVFMQYNREANGKIKPLPKPSVDTGMGFERIAAVMQGVHNNYDIDLFHNIIVAIARLANTDDLTQTSIRVIADHIRSSAFLIADGVVPSNEGRGYVLRRIIRRAIRHGNKIGLREPFFYKLVAPLQVEMGAAYPELTKAQALIEKTLLREEELFIATLEQGLKIFEQEVAALKGNIIPGDVVFRLYDTFGFPLDLTADIARERGYSIDEEGFRREMNLQRERSLAASKFVADYSVTTQTHDQSYFTGYDHLEEKSQIIALLQENNRVEELKSGQKAILILAETPFYAESGGQVGDQGTITTDGGVFDVTDTQKQGSAILHYGQVVSGVIKAGASALAKVDITRRKATALNHSATHLLNAALRKLLGEHVLQKGSLVEPARLRFDFSHFESINDKQIKAIEHLVNDKIRANYLVETKLMTPEEAMDSGAMALFGEKYGDEVRVLCMGDFSMELCGGTHVARTGDIGLFKIVSETGIASGIRRIEAVTGEYALNWVDEREQLLAETAELLKVNPDGLVDKLSQTLQQQRIINKELDRLQAKFANIITHDLVASAETIGSIKVVAKQVENADNHTLREILDSLKQKLPKAVILLASKAEDGKVNLIAGVTSDLTDQFNAGELVKYAAAELGGRGGGRADMAQGAGIRAEKLSEVINSVAAWVRAKIN